MNSGFGRAAFLGIALVTAISLPSCDSIDPTSQSFGIAFQNDVRQMITLKQCSDADCHNFNYSNTIAPGELYPENVSDRNVLTRWLVVDATGRTLGCIALQFDGKYEDVIVRISQAVSCPGERPLKVRRGRRTGRG